MLFLNRKRGQIVCRFTIGLCSILVRQIVPTLGAVAWTPRFILGQDLLPPPSMLSQPAWPGSVESILPESVDQQPLIVIEPADGAPLTEGEVAPSLELADTAIAPTPTWRQLAYWFGPLPWDAGLEFGLNGSEGNNNVLSLRAGGHVNRETPIWKFGSSLGYFKNVANDIETQNNAKLDVRIDRNVDGTQWTLFFLENLIYDEFQAYDVQLSLNTGIGYRFIKTPLIDLLGRFGAGATREIGGVNNEWTPQALFGVDYSHQITPLQKLTAKIDYFPEWSEFARYRVVSDIGWQIDLDRPKNVSLKLSVLDRYDSTPNGRIPNNFDYAVLLIWNL